MTDWTRKRLLQERRLADKNCVIPRERAVSILDYTLQQQNRLAAAEAVCLAFRDWQRSGNPTHDMRRILAALEAWEMIRSRPVTGHSVRSHIDGEAPESPLSE